MFIETVGEISSSSILAKRPILSELLVMELDSEVLVVSFSGTV